MTSTHRPGADALLLLGGAVLMLYGLARGSWAGYSLAAAGGYLACRAFGRGASWGAAKVPPADSPTADAFLRQTFDRLGAGARPNPSERQ